MFKVIVVMDYFNLDIDRAIKNVILFKEVSVFAIKVTLIVITIE